MKIQMNTNLAQREKTKSGFTLIEMIGVLAVIAILASLLIPKVFSAISDARVNGFCVSVDTVKAAVADHYGKYGRMDALFGTNTGAVNLPNGGIAANYDTTVLIPEGLMDKPFASSISSATATNAILQLCNNNGNAGNGYQLDGLNTTTNVTHLIQAVLYNVTQADAQAINDRIDGPTLGVPTGTDDRGRVCYAPPFPTTVYVYVTHR